MDECEKLKAEASQANLELLQLQCVLDAKDREIQGMRARVGEQLDWGDRIQELEAENARLVRALAEAQGAATLAAHKSQSRGVLPIREAGDPAALCASALSLLQQLQVQLGTGREQPSSPSNTNVASTSLTYAQLDASGPAAAPTTQPTEPPGSLQAGLPQNQKSQRHSFEPRSMAAPGLKAPATEPGVAAEVLELNVCGTMMHAARGALLLGGPCSALAQSLGYAAQPGQPQSQAALLRFGRDSAGRLFLPFRPHVFSAVLDFLHELWACLPPTTSGTPPQHGSPHTGRPQLLASPILSHDGRSVGLSGERAVKDVVQSAQEQLLLRSVRATDMEYLERLASQLGLSDLVFGDGAVQLAWAEAACLHPAGANGAVQVLSQAVELAAPVSRHDDGDRPQAHALSQVHHEHHGHVAVRGGPHMWVGEQHAQHATHSSGGAICSSLEHEKAQQWPSPGSLNMYKLLGQLKHSS